MKTVSPNSPMKSEPFKPSRPQLIQNALWWAAAGVYLKSTSVHDYTCHTETIAGSEVSLCLDGGCEYSRVVSSGNPVYEDFSLWEDSPFDMVAERLLWGTFGPKGDQPRRWVPLKECETEHLQAILRTQLHIYETVVEQVVKHWLKKRGIKAAYLQLPVPKTAKKPAKRKARK